MKKTIATAMLLASSVAAAETTIYETEIQERQFGGHGTTLAVTLEYPGNWRNLKIRFSDYPALGYRSCDEIDSTWYCDITEYAADLKRGSCYRVAAEYLSYRPREVQTDKLAVCY